MRKIQLQTNKYYHIYKVKEAKLPACASPLASARRVGSLASSPC